MEQLDGRSFRLVRTITDAGGENRMKPGLDFRIAFVGSTATVSGDCVVRYAELRPSADGDGVGPGRGIDFGQPSGSCSVGGDPAEPPIGVLFVDLQQGGLVISTGFVGWIFEETA